MAFRLQATDWILHHVEAVEMQAGLIIDGITVPVYRPYSDLSDFYRDSTLMSGRQLVEKYADKIFTSHDLDGFHSFGSEIVYTITTRSYDYITERIVNHRTLISAEDTDHLIRLEAPVNITPMSLFLWLKSMTASSDAKATRIRIANVALDPGMTGRCVNENFTVIRRHLAQQRQKKTIASLPQPPLQLTGRNKEKSVKSVRTAT